MSTDIDTRRWTGRIGERFAVDYLTRSLGWAVLEQNWRCPLGEIDIVARARQELVLVEVRTRRGLTFGEAIESVNVHKQRRLRRLAGWLLTSSAYSQFVDDVRIDVLGLLFDGVRVTDVKHIRWAVEAP
ncbi:YraN family protein [Alicyclobacillus shizuokensis]|uniref:YraN family protein n=1 Tax=Alicyclobacillus shizuokensis TaxID=392014 RepID=UPI001C3F1C60|nr:YraN family protein [Alicyclobacillus shizuokensis]MCL6626681.1 YraN family protein [Alicyclobacillus shizuokensis]